MVAADPAWRIEGLGLVAGNASLPVVIDNAARMSAFFGWDAPLHAGRDRPLIGEPITAQTILGDDAMASAGRSLPPARVKLSALSALDALEAAAGPGDLSVLALGPLTNIAIALLARPAIAKGLARIVWMGGSAGAGNHTAAAEFNALCDPDAVQVVLDSGVPFTMVGLDACRTVPVSLEHVAAIRALGGERAAVLADLTEGYVRIARGRPMALYDPVAAAALVAPDSVVTAPARIDVERAAGLTRGMTVCEFRMHKTTPNAHVARHADASRVLRLMHDAFARCATEKVSP